MHTAAIVAFICLAMGVAPSFSLPSSSARANPSGGQDHVNTQNPEPKQFDHYVRHDDNGKVIEQQSLPIHPWVVPVWTKPQPGKLTYAGSGPERKLEDYPYPRENFADQNFSHNTDLIRKKQ
ncbi:hypothetical protein F5148DRAFT_1177504 [Russula earlei]|uniref:Uncharacterized protein n=1 Tax=Russula earlei TaxID=71964 RepID=A0ACC0UHX5_9AGAM|nr:hypothetical protein F5148DRAFT_1177504 [Russula earlei]